MITFEERPIGPRFIQVSHHRRPETPTSPPIGRGYASRASVQGRRSGISTLPTSRFRRRGLDPALRCRLSADGLAQDPARAGVGKTRCQPAQQSSEADKVPPRRTPQRAGPPSPRSTKSSRRRDQRLRKRRRGDGDHHAARAARKHPDAGTVEHFSMPNARLMASAIRPVAPRSTQRIGAPAGFRRGRRPAGRGSPRRHQRLPLLALVARDGGLDLRGKRRGAAAEGALETSARFHRRWPGTYCPKPG